MLPHGWWRLRLRVSEELREYSKLLERVLAKFPELSKEELEAMVEAKLRSSKLLNRVGALLLVAEELGAFKEAEEKAEQSEIQAYTKLGNLVPGLRDVSVRGTVYALSGPIEVKDHRIMRLKIGDDTGSVDVIIWDEKADEAASMKLKLGDQIAVLHGYTRERVETGRPELHVGRGGLIARLEAEGPDPRSFYLDLGEALEAGDGVYDVKAVVLDPGEERRISTRYGEADVREIRLIGEAGGVRLTVWRERVEDFKDLKPGETIYLTDVRIEGVRASLTSRSILAIREKPSEESLRMIEGRKARNLIVRVLDVVEVAAGAILIATDGEQILRVQLPFKEVKPGDHLLVKEAIRESRRGKIRLLCGEEDVEEVEPEEEIKPPSRLVKLAEISSGRKTELVDVIVEGVLYTKTRLMRVRTRFGEVEKVGFWIRDGEAAVQGSAWRAKAEEIARIREGAKVRLKWVSVRMNVFGEPEIQLDNESIIEVLDGSGQEASSGSGK